MSTSSPLRLVSGRAVAADLVVLSIGVRILAQNGFQVSALTGGIRAHFDPRSLAKLPTP